MMQNVVNTEQAKSWDGDDGEHWTAHEEMYNRATERHYAHLLAAASIAPRDRVLDVGCGCGLSTRDAARAASSGHALGIDLSSRMLERARERAAAERLTNVTFEQGDAQVHPFPDASFDAVISRFGGMFFEDMPAAYRNIARAAAARAHLAMLSWQPLGANPWLQEFRAALSLGRPIPGEPNDVPGPFGLATPEHIRRVLSATGWRDIDVQDVDEPMYFGRDAHEGFAALRDMGLARGLAGALGLTEREREEAISRLFDVLRSHETPEGVMMPSRAWLITARRQ